MLFYFQGRGEASIFARQCPLQHLSRILFSLGRRNGSERSIIFLRRKGNRCGRILARAGVRFDAEKNLVYYDIVLMI